MRKKKLVIADLAKELNISSTTISFILNGKSKEKRISNELTDKVIKYVKKVNYTPNQIAKSLRTGKTNLIGLIVENISNPFFANVARLIEEKAYQKGYRIIYCSSENDAEKETQLIRVFRERQIDAYIITPTEGIENEIQALLNDNLTVVLFDRYFPQINTNYVIVDNEKSSYNATNYLVQQGFMHIAFITLSSKQSQMLERLHGYKRAVKEGNLNPIIKRIPFHDSGRNYIKDISDLLKRNKAIDAVFFATNYLGISGLEVIRNLNKRIPDDIAVISFDDHILFKLHSPTITAIAQPIEKLSEEIINILLDHMDEVNRPTEFQQKVLSAELVIRESSQKK